jgi:stage V sporulation protein B
VFPRFAESREFSLRYTPVVSGITFWATLVIVLILAMVANPLVTLFYGPDFNHVPYYIYAMLPGIPFFAVNKVLAQSIAGLGRPELNAVTTAFALIVNISVCFLLYSRFHLLAVAIAISISMITNTLCKILIYRKLSQHNIFSLFSPHLNYLKRYFKKNESSNNSR